MNNEEFWAEAFCAALNGFTTTRAGSDASYLVRISGNSADLALEELRSRRKKKLFEEPENGYR